MKDQELERRIRTAMEHAAPDRLDSILSSCDEQKGEYTNMTTLSNFSNTTPPPGRGKIRSGKAQRMAPLCGHRGSAGSVCRHRELFHGSAGSCGGFHHPAG
ncbi:MAG: hypothetical protein LUB58_04960, partial [Oscillospiraceae bacterium]|nr:hypothetical protein [Oscillospiraceae bacterium]